MSAGPHFPISVIHRPAVGDQFGSHLLAKTFDEVAGRENRHSSGGAAREVLEIACDQGVGMPLQSDFQEGFIVRVR